MHIWSMYNVARLCLRKQFNKDVSMLMQTAKMFYKHKILMMLVENSIQTVAGGNF